MAEADAARRQPCCGRAGCGTRTRGAAATSCRRRSWSRRRPTPRIVREEQFAPALPVIPYDDIGARGDARRTTPSSACAPPSGATTTRWRPTSPAGCRPARCSSTRTGSRPSTCTRPWAGGSSRASASSWAPRACRRSPASVYRVAGRGPASRGSGHDGGHPGRHGRRRHRRGAGAGRRRRSRATGSTAIGARTGCRRRRHGDRRRRPCWSRPASSTCTRTTTRSCSGTRNASPSPLHGVTTVLGGNCGFSLAPLAPEHADYISRMMARVEGMPLAALQAGLPWDWGSFGDWLGRLDGRIAVNAGFLVGHSTLRRLVMGERAVGGDDHGGRSRRHGGGPARRARRGSARLLDLAGAHAQRRRRPAGAVPCREPARRWSAWPPPCGPTRGPRSSSSWPVASTGSPRRRSTSCRPCRCWPTGPVNWNVLGVSAMNPDGAWSQLAAGTAAADRGATVVALTLPHTMQLRLSFEHGAILDGLPGWREVFALPVAERIAALSDPETRRRLDAGAQSDEAGILRHLAVWDRLIFDETFAPENAGLEGRHRWARWRASGASRRSTRCSTSWWPTGCAPGSAPRSPSPRRTGRCGPRPGRTRGPSSAAPTPVPTSTRCAAPSTRPRCSATACAPVACSVGSRRCAS